MSNNAEQGDNSLNRTESNPKSILKSSSKESINSFFKFQYSKSTESKVTPYFMRWCYGVNPKIPAINLSTSTKKLVYYACAHAAIIYDYGHNDVKMLQGHQNEISSISVDESGRWIVSADSGEDNVVIVWDTKTGTAINTLFNIHAPHAPKVISISRNGKYLITVGNEKHPIIKFWLWTYGRQKPDAEYQCQSHVGIVKHCTWNSNYAEHFAITFENNVIFGTWDYNNTLKIHEPQCQKTKNGILTESTYLLESYRVFSATLNGFIIIWSNKIYSAKFDTSSQLAMTNNKNYIKAIKVSEYPINTICGICGYIVIGDANGKIQFYDKSLKLIYYYDKFKFDSIIGISFNVETPCYVIRTEVDKFEQFYPGTSDTPCNHPGYVTEVVSQTRVPSDYTLNRKPFIVPDFLVLTSTGSMDLVHFSKGTLENLTTSARGIITSIATHTTKNIMITGNSYGELVLYDMNSHLVLGENALSILTDEEHQGLKVVNDTIYITALKFSPEGYHLACGLKCGCVWMINCSTLECLTDKPINHCISPIEKICFSSDSMFMAYYDTTNKVCLYHYEKPIMQWKFLGKIRPHYKKITNLLFSVENDGKTQLPNLFSISYDRYLVRYDIENSLQLQQLIIKSAERIEQTAVPLCAIWSPGKNFLDQRLLLAVDNMYKFKYYDTTEAMIHGTYRSPTVGNTPIQRLEVIPQSAFLKSKTEKKYLAFSNKCHIGIQILPPTGNPYSHTAMIGNPVELIGMALSADGKSLITLSKDSTFVFQWALNPRSCEVMERIGGSGLDPYYSLIEGGRNGWLFHEMEDLFYYMQILTQGENTVNSRVVSNKIKIAQLPDLMRACGFYPTEFEVENMLVEAKYKDYNINQKENEEIDFVDFVKLYINHKPTFNISIQELQEAFLELTKMGAGPKIRSIINRYEFIQILSKLGECFSMPAIKKFLSILLHYQEVENNQTVPNVEDVENFDFIPDIITFKVLLEDILGIDLKANFPNMFLEEVQEEATLEESDDI